MSPASPDRPRMRLEGFKALRKGSLLGFASIRLPNGLTVADCPIFMSHEKCWASLPSKPVLDREGRHVEQAGKKRYASILSWDDRATADRWSAAVVDLVREQYPEVFADVECAA